MKRVIEVLILLINTVYLVTTTALCFEAYYIIPKQEENLELELFLKAIFNYANSELQVAATIYTRVVLPVGIWFSLLPVKNTKGTNFLFLIDREEFFSSMQHTATEFT